MGSEAAIAFQLTSGLVEAIGNRKTADKVQSYDPYAGMKNPFGAGNLLQEQASKDEQDAYNAQAEIALSESAQAATAKARDVTRFREGQAEAYNNSGVLQEGSPLDVMNETVVRGREEINALTAQGQAQADLLRRRAAITGNTSRAAIVNSQAAWLTQQTQTRLSQMQTANSLRANSNNSLRAALTSGISLAGSGINYARRKKTPIYDPGNQQDPWSMNVP